MYLVTITAFCVGGATFVGSLIGFLFQNASHKFHDALFSFAAGVMLATAVMGLILPSAELAGTYRIWQTVLGILAGAVFINIMDKFIPHLHNLIGVEVEAHKHNGSLNKVMLFFAAIAIHNLPEGLAAGVGFATEEIGVAISVAAGIALQNIPEGIVVVPPLLIAGVSKARTLLLALFTGLIEVGGTFIGYFAASLSENILPFALAFAGGTMIYVISDEMIPETHGHGHEKIATFSLLVGFIVMMLIDLLISELQL